MYVCMYVCVSTVTCISCTCVTTGADPKGAAMYIRISDAFINFERGFNIFIVQRKLLQDNSTIII